MKAWQYVSTSEPITLRDVEPPAVNAGEVLIAVKAAGICHTDVGFLDGTMSAHLPFSPITLGHEVAGIIAEVGAGVTDFAVGDRVAVRADRYGLGTARDGGFQPLVGAPTDLLIPVPAGVAWDQAAVATDAGGSAYRAIMSRGKVSAGMKVGIIGFGGLGSLGAQLAMREGAAVYVAEINEDLHREAVRIGATAVASSIEDFVNAGLDVIVDFAGYGTTTAAAIECVRPGGRVVQVGLAVDLGTVSLQTLTMNEVDLVGSLGGTNADNARVLALMASGELRSQTVKIRFDDVGEALATLQRGGTVGRFVVDYEA